MELKSWICRVGRSVGGHRRVRHGPGRLRKGSTIHEASLSSLDLGKSCVREYREGLGPTRLKSDTCGADVEPGYGGKGSIDRKGTVGDTSGLDQRR